MAEYVWIDGTNGLRSKTKVRSNSVPPAPKFALPCLPAGCCPSEAFFAVQGGFSNTTALNSQLCYMYSQHEAKFESPLAYSSSPLRLEATQLRCLLS